MHYPKISIVTPNYNGGKYLEETILSILNQGYPNLEYIIIDGGSTDNSVEIIKRYETRLSYWLSEKDNGMYEALNKGFKHATGEIMGYLNSDDIHFPHTLKTIAYIFNKKTEVQWLTGVTCNMNQDTIMIDHGSLSSVSSKQILLGENYPAQESTFWKRKLWIDAGNSFNAQLRLAGDFELWVRFAQQTEIYNSYSLTSSFRIHSGQLSGDYVKYSAEMKKALAMNNVQLTAKDKRIKFLRKLINGIPGIRNIEFFKNYLLKMYGVKYIHV